MPPRSVRSADHRNPVYRMANAGGWRDSGVMRLTGTPQPIHAIHHLAEHQQHDAISHAVASDHPCEIQSSFTSELIRISNDLS